MAPAKPKRTTSGPSTTGARTVEVHHTDSPPVSPSTERSPLLGDRPRAPRKRWRPFVGWLVLICLVAGVAVAFTSVRLDEPSDDAEPVQFAEPRVDILNIDDAGLHLNLSMLAGVDADDAIAQESHGKWWSAVARRTARTAMGLGVKVLDVDVPEIAIYAGSDDAVSKLSKLPLLQIQVPGTLSVPVIRKDDPLEPFSFEAIALPLAPVSESWDWLQQAWKTNDAKLIVSIPQAKVKLPIASFLSYSASDLTVPFEGRMPVIPNFPKPGHPLNLTQLVDLRTYTVSTDDGLRITARAAVPNPGLPADIGERLDFGVPFDVELEKVPVAQGVATLSGVSRTHLFISVNGLGTNLTGKAEKPLSRFLQRFMKGLPNSVTVRGQSEADPGLPRTKPVPGYLAQRLSDVQANLTFPGPDPVPELVKSMSIEDMSIEQAEDGGMAASGTMVAILEMPKGLEGVKLNVTGVRPDVLIYDGETVPQDPYDPDHPPPRTFSRIATQEFLNATTTAGDDGAVVRAPFKHLPLRVLDGHESVFQSFIRKIILQRGALAGIDGVADARATLPIGEMDVAGLPVNGSMWIGRGTILGMNL